MKLKITALILLLGLFLYFNTFESSFHFDDKLNIFKNTAVHLTKISTESILLILKKSVAVNRPVANLSLSMNYYLGELDVLGYHIFNISIHLVTGIILLFLLIKTLSLTRPYRKNRVAIALSATLIWIVHPVNIQAVTYIIQRMASLAAMFYLLSLLLYITARQNKDNSSIIYYALSLFSWFLAMGSKEISAALPVIIFIYEVVFFKTDKKQAILIMTLWMLPVLIIGTFYLGGINGIKDTVTTILDNSYKNRDYTLIERLITQPRVIFYYLLVYIFPLSSRLTLDYDFPVSADLMHPVTTIISIMSLLFLTGYSMKSIWRGKLSGFCIFWYLSNLAIESSIFNLEIAYEHRLYLPGIMIILLFVVLSFNLLKDSIPLNLPKPFQPFPILILSIVFTLSFFTVKRNFSWKDSISLWSHDLKNSPRDARVYNNLGTAYFEKEDLDKALILFERAVSLKPGFSEPCNNLGIIYRKKGLHDKSLDILFKALKVNPNHPGLLTNIGATLIEKGKTDKGIGILFDVIISRRNFPDAYTFIGYGYIKKGLLFKAVNFLKMGNKINNNLDTNHYNLGLAYEKLGLYRLARAEIRKAIELYPSYDDAKRLLKTVLTKLKE